MQTCWFKQQRWGLNHQTQALHRFHFWSVLNKYETNSKWRYSKRGEDVHGPQPPVNDLICFGGSLVVPWWFLGGLKFFAVGVHVLLSIFWDHVDHQQQGGWPSLSTSSRLCNLSDADCWKFSIGTHMNQQAEPTHNMEKPSPSWHRGRSYPCLFAASKFIIFAEIHVFRDIFPMFDRYFWRYSKNSKHGFLIFLPRSDQRLAARCSRPRKLLLPLPLRAKAARAGASPMSRTGRPSRRNSTAPWTPWCWNWCLDSEKLPKSWPPNLSVLWLLWYENHGEMTLMDTNRLIVDYKLRSTWFYWWWRSPEL